MFQKLNEVLTLASGEFAAWRLDSDGSPPLLRDSTIPTGLQPNKHDDRTRDTARSGTPTTTSSTFDLMARNTVGIRSGHPSKRVGI
jgi:hypothetical protein